MEKGSGRALRRMAGGQREEGSPYEEETSADVSEDYCRRACQRSQYPFLSLSFPLLPVPSSAFPGIILSYLSCSLSGFFAILSFPKG